MLTAAARARDNKLGREYRTDGGHLKQKEKRE